MKMKRITTAVCVILGLLQAGCEEDRKIAPVPDTTINAAATQAPTAAPAAGPPRKQQELTCPSGWEEFCGGWTVVDMTADSGGKPEEHIAQCQRFVIGEKSGKLYIFPRGSALQDLWSAKKVQLEQLTTGGKCLTGKVKLKHEEIDAWHRITLTTGPDTSEPEIGEEVILNVAFMAEAQGDPTPTSCPVLGSSGDTERDHGGLAHAED